MIAKSKDVYRPAFIVGVTGHMRFTPQTQQELETKLQAFFQWLRSKDVVPDFHPRMRGLGISENTPLTLLSCLAPGADVLVAQMARQVDRTVRVVGVLPLLRPSYANATTYTSGAPTAQQALALLNALPEEDILDVRLTEHEHLDLNELAKKHAQLAVATDAAERTVRHRCYQAAGERVAGYAHILLALTDVTTDDLAQDVDPGAKRILNVQLRGLTPHLASGTSALSWADTGPVFHLYATRDSNEAEAGQLRFLDPTDDVDAKGQRTPKEDLNPKGEANLRAIAEALDRFNSADVSPADLKAAEREWCEKLGAKATAQQPAPIPAHIGPATHLALHRIGYVRKVAAVLNSRFDEEVKWDAKVFHVLTFLFVFFLNVYEFGRPAHETEHAMFSGTFWWRTALLATGLACLTYAALRFGIAHGLHRNEQQNDYRALAEGLRVQLYWTAAGLSTSVASYYLLRQRDTLTWIRYAMRGISFPFRPAADEFNALPRQQQLDRLRLVAKTWILEQRTYFTSSRDKDGSRNHLLHQRSVLLLWLGLWLLLAEYLVHTCHLAEYLYHLGTPAVIITTVASVVSLVVLTRQAAHHRQVLAQKRTLGHRALNSSWLHELTHAWLPSMGMALAFASALVTAVLVTATTTAPYVSEANLLTMLRNWALAGSGLLHLYNNTRFHKENMRRYSAMAALFNHAEHQVNAHLNSAEKALNEPDFVTHIMMAQEVFHGLGREALAENTEWLTMHRDRPVEPVAPGG